MAGLKTARSFPRFLFFKKEKKCPVKEAILLGLDREALKSVPYGTHDQARESFHRTLWPLSALSFTRSKNTRKASKWSLTIARTCFLVFDRGKESVPCGHSSLSQASIVFSLSNHSFLLFILINEKEWFGEKKRCLAQEKSYPGRTMSSLSAGGLWADALSSASQRLIRSYITASNQRTRNGSRGPG